MQRLTLSFAMLSVCLNLIPCAADEDADGKPGQALEPEKVIKKKDQDAYVQDQKPKKHEKAEKLPYGLVAITNNSGQTVTYQYRWGKNGGKGKGETTLRPGQTSKHWWNYGKRQGFSPKLEIEFPWTIRRGNQVAPGLGVYTLEKHQSPDKELENAKTYKFDIRRTPNGNHVDLFQSTPKK